jgi:hypothetical protein
MNEWQAEALGDVMNDARNQANIARRRRITPGPQGTLLVVILAVDR